MSAAWECHLSIKPREGGAGPQILPWSLYGSSRGEVPALQCPQRSQPSYKLCAQHACLADCSLDWELREGKDTALRNTSLHPNQ